MGRTRLSRERLTEIKRVNIGRIIIFCEGVTEKLYLDYFAKIINGNKFTDIRIETQSADGNSRTVYKYAEEFLEEEEHNREYSNYQKYLVFDCDDPPDIQQVILDMQGSDKGYSLIVSNLLFELWLLMHFESIQERMGKKAIYERLSDHLNEKYKKADSGIIREIINNGNLEDAIKNGDQLAKKYRRMKKRIYTNIEEMNPYTNIYTLIEQFLAEMS
ncbi:RloB family protein [Sporolactobacillus sp. CQH2019]|uniref:RloB family protein n=1 Tax=Sporolactobacillus sp. CQH2019 TaxID=3023512 RepID=UPI002368828D|nr:RloB family protein [Sporolactobacillus sp. CQH2019]MDD9149839.1 RloB family protein [Sporolactobacillus sp. CQH2019]